MKKILLIFITIFFVNAAEIEKWSVVGLSGNAYKIDVLNESEKGRFVAAYQVWRHLNFTRSEKGDTIIAKSGKNELKFVKNSSQYFVNGSVKEHNYPIIYKDGVNYCDINSFCAAMNLLTGLHFDADFSAKKIKVSKKEVKEVKTKEIKETKEDKIFIEEIGDDKVFGVVVIDPGHGGKDPGAIGPNGTNEKDVVLPISLEIKNYLSRFSGVKIYLTREDDTFLPLSERTAFANSKNADLFVSVHANASETSVNVGGYKMYFLSEAKNESDEWTARLENSVLNLEGESQMSGLESILFSLANSEFIKESQDFSIMLEKSFGKNIKDIQRLHTGVGQANFYVLNGASMPAVLVETAFISNPKEEKLLANEKFQKKTGDSIGAAIVEFLKKYPSDGR
ncbi:MAG: N-acetylmuramoyl-L-alanine amidase [Chitinivibrionia bacterium]|nr:N-acetylmuramoyl-L-alanine amidase [Chitinivibrionia bacterium]